MLNLIWLKSLITVIEQRSFQAAAEQLGLAQPTISQHIQKLEETLCVCLIHRVRVRSRPYHIARCWFELVLVAAALSFCCYHLFADVGYRLLQLDDAACCLALVL